MAVSSNRNGGYQAFRLGDTQVKTRAFHRDFPGDSKGEWNAPPPCANL